MVVNTGKRVLSKLTVYNHAHIYGHDFCDVKIRKPPINENRIRMLSVWFVGYGFVSRRNNFDFCSQVKVFNIPFFPRTPCRRREIVFPVECFGKFVETSASGIRWKFVEIKNFPTSAYSRTCRRKRMAKRVFE